MDVIKYSISTWNDYELFSEAKSNDIIQNQFLKKKHNFYILVIQIKYTRIE